jgi:hypothetical protein
MVIIEQLRISDNGERLYLDVHVNKASYFDNIYLDKIYIATADQVSEADPLSPGNEYIYEYTVEGNIKELHAVLTPAMMNEHFDKCSFSEDLLFVYIVCKGSVGECTPCRLDELTTLGVTFDEALLHQQVLAYTQQLAADCTVPQGFTDFILLWQAFKSAIETEHYIPAIKYWNMLFDNHAGSGGYIGNKGDCGCHGKNRL